MGPLSAPAQASTSAVLTATDPAAPAADSRFVALLSVKDAAVAQAWFDQLVASSGEKTTTQTYGSTKLTVYADSETKVDLAFGIVDGKVALLGDLTSVKAAIDTKGAGPLASDPAFRAAQAANVGDQVGFFFVRLKALVDQAKAMSPSLGAEAAGVSDTLTSLVPEWASGRLRIESDALVIDGATPHVDGAPGPTTNHVNAVADHAPPTTIALAAGNDVGATVTSWIELLRKDPKLSEAFKQIDQAVAMAGGWDGVVGWMGDTGVVISAAGDAVEGGVISVPTDGAKAQRFFTTIRSAILLGGGQLGFKVTDETYAGATITVVDLGPIKDLAAQAAGPDAGSMSVLGGSLPAGNATIAYAVTDTVVVIGSSPDFVKHALDAGTGDSLADTARYHDLLARVGASGTGVTYLDISAARAAAERHLADMPAADKAEYEASVKPFLTPFDAFIASGVTGPELVQQHSLITVK